MKISFKIIPICLSLIVGLALFQTQLSAALPHKVKVSSNDSTPGFLNGKLVAGGNIAFTEGSDGGNETLTIAADSGSADTAPTCLFVEGTTADANELQICVTDPSADRTITFPDDGLAANDVLVGNASNTVEYLAMADKDILIGDGAGAPTTANLSGDVTMDNAGVVSVVDMTCTDCINATEIEDIYVLIAGDTMTGQLQMNDAAGPTLVNEAATSTNPTLIPNKADLNTGIGWESADDLSLITNGIERLRISNSGNVFNLTTGAMISGVITNSGGIINETSSTTNPTLLPDRADETAGIGATAGGVTIITGGLERITTDSSGNVDFQSGNLTTTGTLAAGATALTNLLTISKAVNGRFTGLLIENSQIADAGTNETAEIKFGFGGNNNVARITVDKLSDYTTVANEDSRIGFWVDVDGTLTQIVHVMPAGLMLTLPDSRIRFAGTNGGGGQSISYNDSGGGNRTALHFPGNDIVVLGNRAANGNVEIRANTSTAGAGGEVTVATFEDSQIVFNEVGGDTDFRVESDNNMNMWVLDAGQENIGINAAPNANRLVDIAGSFSGNTGLSFTTTLTSNAEAQQVFVGGIINVTADTDAHGVRIAPTLVEAGSGTHSNLNSVTIVPPVITAGVAALTNASTVKITGAPTGAVNNYAVWIDAGHIRLDDPVYIEEQAEAAADVAGFGQFWVDTATPNVPMFTDDAGTDFVLGGSGDIITVGLCTTGACTDDFIDKSDFADEDWGELGVATNVVTIESTHAGSMHHSDESAASTTTAGISEYASAAEMDTGTSTTLSLMVNEFTESDWGKRVIFIILLDDTTDTAVKDGTGDIELVAPTIYDGWDINNVECGVYVVGTTNSTKITLHNVTAGADVTSTACEVETAEFHSKDATQQPVIDTGQDDVTDGDRYRFDIDAISTTAAKGAWMELTLKKP